MPSPRSLLSVSGLLTLAGLIACGRTPAESGADSSRGVTSAQSSDPIAVSSARGSAETHAEAPPENDSSRSKRAAPESASTPTADDDARDDSGSKPRPEASSADAPQRPGSNQESQVADAPVVDYTRWNRQNPFKKSTDAKSVHVEGASCPIPSPNDDWPWPPSERMGDHTIPGKPAPDTKIRGIVYWSSSTSLDGCLRYDYQLTEDIAKRTPTVLRALVGGPSGWNTPHSVEVLFMSPSAGIYSVHLPVIRPSPSETTAQVSVAGGALSQGIAGLELQARIASATPP